MKIIKPNAELLTHDIPAYQFIEKVGRTCYKSEDKITDISAVNFVKALVKNKHLAMLEHEYLYLFIGTPTDLYEFMHIDGLMNSDEAALMKYFNIHDDIVSGSFRAWIELFDKIENEPTVRISSIYVYIYKLLNEKYPEIFNNEYYLKDNEGYEDLYSGNVVFMSRKEAEKWCNDYSDAKKILPHTIKFTCDRGVSHEFVRHRPASFAQESTRYCNYSHNKFGNELTFIKPPFWDIESDNYASWYDICTRSETAYLEMLKNGTTPEQARSILPNSLKTELIITATEEEWQHIVDLRYHGTTGKPHPQMKEVMNIAYPLLVQSSEGRIK